MNIDSQYIRQLPVGAIAAEVNSSLASNPRLVVTAPPGSGKSTLLPLTIAAALPEGKVMMLEPRRAAARQIAMRMAYMLSEKAGQTVGYRMRFESKVSSQTRIEVVTEGVMERMLVDDPTLDGVGAVIFDEFHERSLTADVSLALTIEAQNLVRPDLLIVIMSATIDTDALCSALGSPVIRAQGRMHDVRIIYGEDAEMRGCQEAVAQAVARAWREQTGDILAFLPGQGEIAACAQLLGPLASEAEILPLHGMLTPAEQYRAIESRPDGKRKIVLATPIAETSLTIDGIRTVVDSGLCRAARFDASTGLTHLVTERISADMARQRAGRAGRTADGVCYRLWSKAAEHQMRPERTPEILEADLSGMMLSIAAWGGNAKSLPWLTPPPPARIAEASRLLAMLDAIDEKGKITPLGKRMAALPCHPRIAHMLVCASSPSLKALAADIAAVLEDRPRSTDSDSADIGLRIEALRRQRRRGISGMWKRTSSIAAQYRRLAGCNEDNTAANDYDIGMLIASAYPERIAMRLHDAVYRLPSGENVSLSDADDLTAADFLAVAAVDRRIFLASPVKQSTLEEMASSYRNMSWNSKEGQLIARDELRIGVLVISSRRIENPDAAEAAQIIANAAQKEGRSMFDFSEEVQRLQRRVATMASWHPELGLPDVSIDGLLASASEWLPLYIGKARSAQDLRRISIVEVIKGIVGYGLMQEVDRIAPERIKLPCGKSVRIDYRTASEAPVVSARIQDCLGMTDTPRLDGGRRPVLMELLSPGFKPVQLTQDLRGFWTTTYFDVRKELRRRYPKHRWPDNPLDLNECN